MFCLSKHCVNVQCRCKTFQTMFSEDKLFCVLKINSNVYKWCTFPQYKNTSKKSCSKLFAYVPNKKIMRDIWLNLAR